MKKELEEVEDKQNILVCDPPQNEFRIKYENNKKHYKRIIIAIKK